MTQKPSRRKAGGRPAKFREPSRPITVTLPLRILDALAGIDADRAKAIVKAVEGALGIGRGVPTPVLEVPFNKKEALLAITDNRLLRRIPWLTLIEIAPGRHLISLKGDTPLEKLEVTLGDILDAPGDATPAELELVRQLLLNLRAPRRNRTLRPEAILIVGHAPAD